MSRTGTEFRIRIWGGGGPLYVEPARDRNPIANALLKRPQWLGFPPSQLIMGTLMESPSGASLLESCLHDGKLQSVFRSYVYPP